MIERAPFFYPQVLEDPPMAKGYAERAAKRAKRVGQIYVMMLKKEGFEQGRILDVGSGGGDMLIEIALGLPKLEAVGVDLAEPLIEIASKKAEEAGISDRVSFAKADVQAMPFEDDSFDVVVSLNTLHVVSNPVVMLDEIERVLAPLGRFSLSDIKRSWLGRFMKMLATAYSIEEVKEILERSKLRRPGNILERTMWFAVTAGDWRNQ